MNEFEFVVGGETIKSKAKVDNDSVVVDVNGIGYRFQAIGENLFRAGTESSSHIVAAVRHNDVIYIDIDATVVEVRDAAAVENADQHSSHHLVKDKVFAPMPGKIVKIMVNKGDQVTEKQPLAIVEAMKMENQINSPASGRVKSINFAAGAQVNTTSPIIELDLEPTA